jgi:hypothetical protein
MDKKQIVTFKTKTSQTSSNVYYQEEKHEDEVFLSHPLAPGLFKKANLTELNLFPPVQKDDLELTLSYAFQNTLLLDFNNKAKVESLCFFYFVKKYLSSVQKQELSCVLGFIASIKLDNSIEEASKLILNNLTLLDEFNLMWYNKLELLINGKKPILSFKQRNSIFNMAGWVLSQIQPQKVEIG